MPFTQIPHVDFLHKLSTVVRVRKLMLMPHHLIFRPSSHVSSCSILPLSGPGSHVDMVVMSVFPFIWSHSSIPFMALTLSKNTDQLFVMGISKVSVFIFKHSRIGLRKIGARMISVHVCRALLCDVQTRTSSQECSLRSHLLPSSLAFFSGVLWEDRLLSFKN